MRSSTSAALRPSWACRPAHGSWWSARLASAPCMRLERRPRRRLPAQAFFYVGRMLMHPDRGAVDHLQVAVIGARYRGEDAVPDAAFPPPDKAVVAGRAGA